MKICITGSGNIKPQGTGLMWEFIAIHQRICIKGNFTGDYNPEEPQDINILGRDFMTGQMARE